MKLGPMLPWAAITTILMASQAVSEDFLPSDVSSTPAGRAMGATRTVEKPADDEPASKDRIEEVRGLPRDRQSTSGLPLTWMPGEFEEQQFLLLSCGDLTLDHVETISEIVLAVHRHIRVVVLFMEEAQREALQETLGQRLDPPDDVLFLRMDHDTKWIRDFGPTVVRSGGQSIVVDWRYDETRPNDDHVPFRLARATSTECKPASLQVEGGNLLSNGLGLCVTTTALVERNGGLSKRVVCNALKRSLGAQEVVVLERLAGEETGHVDMFTTFTGPTTVVVGSYSPAEDPVNAALLDRNAARLAAVETPWGPLRVERIPMGRQHDGLWRTYTNCVYANGVLLVPFYLDGDEIRSRQALAVYRRLLPRWHIVFVDATPLIEEGGALHCAALNVPSLAKPLRRERLHDEQSARMLTEGDSAERLLP